MRQTDGRIIGGALLVALGILFFLQSLGRIDFVGLAAQFVKDMQAVFPDPRNLSAPMFTPKTLKSVEAQIVEKCDAVATGLVHLVVALPS